MMNLLEKLELVAENQPEVYEAGAKTFGATETKSGIGSVTLTNVHPVEHDINVAIKTKSKNLIDISQLGGWNGETVVENGIQINYVNIFDSYFTINVFDNAAEYLNKPLYISIELDNIQTDDDNFELFVVPFYHGYDYFGAMYPSKTATKVSMPIMFKESDIDPEYNDYSLALNFILRSSDSEPHDYSFLIKNIQVEISEEVTEYEPYFPSIDPTQITVTNGDKTVTLDENGIANIASVYPTTQLTLSRDDVELTADYFVDVNNISEGVDTSDATATEGDILSGKTAYVDGEKVTGNIPTKTSNDITAKGNIITIPSGYYATQVKKPVTAATQATPSITVNASGLITATASQTAGYVAAGSKSATKQLAFAPAKTITPSATSQVAVSSGYYTGGDITVAGDANLIANNIKSGVSIFGVNGTYEGDGGTGEVDHSAEDGVITRTISGFYENSRVTQIGIYAFNYCASLASVNFPACTRIGNYAFGGCAKLASVNFPACTSIEIYAFSGCRSLASVNFPACRSIGIYAFTQCASLASVNFPACTSIGNYAFSGCYSLASVNFPACRSIGSYAFSGCAKLASVNFPACTSIGNYAFNSCYSLANALFGMSILSTSTITPKIFASAFYRCSKLTNLTLYYSSVAALSNINAFASTPMSVSTLTGSFGSIYVPASLVSAYKSATNWATYADRITSIEGDNGEGDEVTLINFTINDVPYQAEEGMTWAEWINSDYNTDGYYAATYENWTPAVQHANGTDFVMLTNNGINFIIDSSYTIENGGTYTLGTSGWEV